MLSATGSYGSSHTEVTDGNPVANFALTVNAGADGGLFGNVFQNTGVLDGWLIEKGGVRFSLEKDGNRLPFSHFHHKEIERRFPFVRGAYSQSTLDIQSELKTLAFCPLAVDDAETSSLPVAMLEMTFVNAGEKADEFIITVDYDSLRKGNLTTELTGSQAKKKKFRHLDRWMFSSGDMVLRCNSELTFDLNNRVVHIPVRVPAKGGKTLRLILAFYDDEWITAGRFASAGEIASYADDHWNDLYAGTLDFEDHIPRTGDTELDEYLRWYMIPAVSLTRLTKNNEVLTMGYCELNQRDSYWTSWLHLVLFRDLEKKMIEESIAWQQPSGKIPTTILPLIEREDDLDINAFFILRAARFYRLYPDRDDLQAWWPALKKAMDWLISRDTNGNGLPVQVSFWGDWKDVTGVDGRIYSPFSALVYLAALRQMEYLGRECGDIETISKYESAYKKGFDFTNTPVEQGGLWNGMYYCQRWKDGTVNDKLLQDQTIGILFDVVPEEKAVKIIESLNEKNLTEYGICETYPYYPAEFGYEPGTYHNGGVWPWLSFVDDWARIRMGREKEAIGLVKRVAKADLVMSGDWSPNEYINSRTGENQGYQLQGWNAGLFGLVYFGLLHKDMIHH
ncbi:MAG: hypothetical protein LBG18_07670 [Mediterranea sp.]|nr:hypothetical protein [Mediterranea sp.]